MVYLVPSNSQSTSSHEPVASDMPCANDLSSITVANSAQEPAQVASVLATIATSSTGTKTPPARVTSLLLPRRDERKMRPEEGCTMVHGGAWGRLEGDGGVAVVKLYGSKRRRTAWGLAEVLGSGERGC
ncbi:hypothetical protein L1987_42566 [Smallanthus sonchifolius]|uniref:Uncharacterized protein n=1 Tax=Smallanthus sonchifolius TaxID=185202 RepID=A0ACB9GJA8_9ASTR|nr:hypothetical protein L1987_42566 [Smallanthus sonchifolius]